MIGTGGFMATAFDDEEPMTPEDVLLRFKKIMGRDMTPEEKHKFFLPESPEGLAERLKQHHRDTGPKT
jgi:hypothetical protein